MGNANGTESGGEGSNHAAEARVNSGDPMASSPPHDHHPHQHRPPTLFSSQTPSVPLPKNEVPSLFNMSRQNNSRPALDSRLEQGIPTIITWSLGGDNVSVEGSWDGWRTRKSLQRSSKDHSILLVLPSGIYRYKFVVDGQVRYIPDLPCETDDMGHVCNLIDVNNYVPENLDGIAEFQVPGSPESSYNQTFPGDEEFAKDPMLVPPQLENSKEPACSNHSTSY